jgi:hypothetical protein
MVYTTFAGDATWNELVRGARRYYWVMQRMNCAPGTAGHAGRVPTWAATGLRDLLSIALPSAAEDDRCGNWPSEHWRKAADRRYLSQRGQPVRKSRPPPHRS